MEDPAFKTVNVVDKLKAIKSKETTLMEELS